MSPSQVTASWKTASSPLEQLPDLLHATSHTETSSMHRAITIPSHRAMIPYAKSSNSAVNDGNCSALPRKWSKSNEVLTTIKQCLAKGLLKYLR